MINLLSKEKLLRKTLAMLLTVCFFVVLLCSCDKPIEIVDEKELPKLVIGVDYLEPYVYKNDEGDFAGIDVELAKKICHHIGYQPEFVKINWKDKNTYLEAGEIDCIWCCFTVTGRENDYNCTLPYMKGRIVVAVPSESDIKVLSDLDGKKLAVQSATKADEFFSGNAKENLIAVPNLKELNCYTKIESVFSALSGGYVDAIAVPELVLGDYVNSSSFNLRVLDQAIIEVDVGIAFLKGHNLDISEKINKTIVLLRNTGFLGGFFAEQGLNPDMYLVDYEKEA